MSQSIAGGKSGISEERAKLEGRTYCAVCYSVLSLDAGKTTLSPPATLCVITELGSVSWMLWLLAKNQEGSWFLALQFINTAGSPPLMHLNIPYTSENIKTSIYDIFMHGQMTSIFSDTHLMLGRRVAAGGGGESRGGTSYSSLPRWPLEKTWKEIKRLI